MASPGNSETWQSESGISGDDDMEYEPASSEALSFIDDGDSETGNDEVGEGETTLYYDAEEGTLRDADGDEVTFEMTTEDEDEEVEDGSAADEGEAAGGTGSRTPRATAAAATAASPNVERNTFTLTQEQIMQLFSTAGLQGLLAQLGGGGLGPTTRSRARAAANGVQHVALADDDDDEQPEDDEDESEFYLGYRQQHGRQSRREFTGPRYPPIPSEEGKQLMNSGTFGTNDRCGHTACGVPFEVPTQHKRRRLARRMLDREMGVDNRGRLARLGMLAAQDMIPSSRADVIVNINAKCYSGQFSEDGSFFFACGQDFKVRMYDTSNPYSWKYYKTVHYYGGQWTITDASLSPDNKHLAYSSIRSQACLASTDPNDSTEPTILNFRSLSSGSTGTGGRGWTSRGGDFGIWSLRFSGDGTEIVAGTGDDSVYVYDLEAQRSILRIPAHRDDVNAVCFGDKMSPHILYSGSDDTTLKVWDRRSLSSMRPAGMFLGHTEGLTYIDSKGDGRYVISNGKDQTCKLWDLRHMISTDEGERINPQEYTTNFDYRFSPYDTDHHRPHPHDCSLVTFRGHRVLKTLIRCHFSPAGSTDGRYVYSGSHDGKIYVWNLDGTTKGTINVWSATKNSRPVSVDERYTDPRYDYYGRSGSWKTIVRDCSWHPSAPVIAATSWNGWDHGLGTCTVHSWNDGLDGDEIGEHKAAEGEFEGDVYAKASSLGEAPMGARVTAQLAHDDRFYGQRTPAAGTRGVAQRATRLRDRMGMGAWLGGDYDGDGLA